MNTQSLTDDELVAIALSAEAAWPGPVPTVQVENPAELAVASMRGQRSLAVRGLVAEDGVLSDGLVRLRDVARSRTAQILVYLGDAAFAQASAAMLLAGFATDDGWLLDVITPSGIHDFRVLEAEALAAYLAGILAPVAEGGIGAGFAPADRVVVLSRTTRGGRRLVVTKGEATLQTLDAAGEPARSPEPVGLGAEALTAAGATLLGGR